MDSLAQPAGCEAEQQNMPTTASRTLRPRPSARVWHTAMVWGWHLEDTRNLGFLPRATALHTRTRRRSM